MTAPPHTLTRRRTYLIGRARPQAIVGRNRETGEIALVVVGAFLGMMSGLLIPALALRIVGLAGFPMLALAAVYMPYNGRTFYRWFEINRHFRRTQRRGATYRSAAAEAGTSLDGREIEIGAPPGVGRVQWLAAAFGPDELAVLLHTDRRTITAAIEIEGPGVGLRDSEDQEALVERFGSLLKHVANGDGHVTRLQMLARTLPADPDAHANDVRERGDALAPHWIQDSYDQLQSMVSTSSEQHRAYLVACMHHSRELSHEAQTIARASRVPRGNGGRQRRMTQDEALAVIMARELADICARLAEADIRVRQPLGEARLSSLIHSMYDPDHPIDHIQAMTKRNAWPAELDAREATYLQAKTRESDTREPWCHATAWVKEWPMTPVGVNFLAPLLVHTPDVIRTVAVCMDLEPTEIAIERMLTEKTNDEAERSRAAKMNRTVDPRDVAAHGRVDQRGDDLASGAAGVNLVGYLTVSSPHPEALARDKRTIRASAGKSYLKLEWCDREHHRAFVNTLPFATGIRR
ncbi:SCO6880 family protein [Streptomyces sp. DSM 44917]|uniref:SCO6880 family protein n=1 Tax=Streptomyces boetiae TaxID=3075541 RepID=A0ABU2LBZ9_9ACTN|nr:SCO6880 family protein [Streptomyces sp. DSM 44917]MDT0309107.1 SCO6880 family protein [Streptomyces sp. DSM 44917]